MKSVVFIKQVPVYTMHRLAWSVPGDTEVRHSMVCRHHLRRQNGSNCPGTSTEPDVTDVQK